MPAVQRRRSAARGGEPKPSRRPTGNLRRFADAARSGGLILPPTERYLLTRTDDERRQDVIHVSELAKSDWCPRAVWQRITAARTGVIPAVVPVRFQLENIFDEGHHIHEKWQRRWTDMGNIWGRWRCTACGWPWQGQASKDDCPKCGADWRAHRYEEVELWDPELLLVGHADAELRGVTDDDTGVLVEIKSIGEGTVRLELPQTHARYTRRGDHTCFDMQGLFRDIRRPFPSHARQLWVYLWMRERAFPDEPPVSTGIGLYEAKSTQATKEFAVSRNDRAIEELLADANDVVYALEVDRPPRCSKGRSGCSQCKEKRDDDKGVEAGRDLRAQPGDARGARDAREDAPRPRREASRRPAADPERSERPVRRGADEPHEESRALGRLLGLAARDG